MNKIRKFLKCTLDEPLEVYYTPQANHQVKYLRWIQDARNILVNGLVASGMYEECVEYNLPEAIRPLILKFLGSAFTETEKGLVAVSHTGHTTSHDLAMKKACTDREWRHIWSVLSIMEYKYGRAHFLHIPDPTYLMASQASIPPKLALVFTNGFEDGLQGF